MEKTIIGIDISKKDFCACINGKVVKYNNDTKGIQAFIKAIPESSHCVMESTSTYGYALAQSLNEANHQSYIVNPLKIKYFVRMNLSKAKTDAIDAVQITRYAKLAFDDLMPYKVVSKDLEECKQLETVIEQLTKQRIALVNQLEALNQYPIKNKKAIKTLEKLIEELAKQIKELEEEAARLVKKEYGQMYDNISSIPGIGNRTAVLLIALTHGFTKFENAKQVSSFFGCCPRVFESGSSVRGRGNISKIGHAHVRSILYMCALSARRFNNTCKELFARLCAKGKPFKVAQLAVVNKLIKQIFAVVKKNELFDNSYKISLVN